MRVQTPLSSIHGIGQPKKLLVVVNILVEHENFLRACREYQASCIQPAHLPSPSSSRNLRLCRTHHGCPNCACRLLKHRSPTRCIRQKIPNVPGRHTSWLSSFATTEESTPPDMPTTTARHCHYVQSLNKLDKLTLISLSGP